MKKIIMSLIKDILIELGSIITIGLMSLVIVLDYDTHPILCSATAIIGIITIIFTFWNTYDVVLIFEILILHIQAYIDELIIRRLLKKYIEEIDDSEIIDEYLYK